MFRIDRTDDSNTPINVDMSKTKRQLGLTWVGQYYSRYGEIQLENFLRLLENFASDEQPSTGDDVGLVLKNVMGQLWYHTNDTDNLNNKTLKVYDDNRYLGTDGWKRLEPIISQDEPTAHAEGELWYNPSTNVIKISRGVRWESTTVQLAKDSERLGGFTSEQFIRSDVDDTVYGTLRTSELLPNRHLEYDLGKSNSRWETIYGNTIDVNSSHDLKPEFTDRYDLGKNASRWRELYVAVVDASNFKNINPLLTDQYSIGTPNRRWKSIDVGTANVEFLDTTKPKTNTSTLGDITSRWDYLYVDTLDATDTNSLIPSTNNAKDLGSSTKVWHNIYVDVIKTTKTETLRPRLDGTYDLGSVTTKYKNLYVDNIQGNVVYKGDIKFDIIRNSKSSGIVWEGLSDTHSIYVEEYGNNESTRLVIENRDNPSDHTTFRSKLNNSTSKDLMNVRENVVEVVAGTLRSKGTVEVEDESVSHGCEMKYNNSNETLEFRFY